MMGHKEEEVVVNLLNHQLKVSEDLHGRRASSCAAAAASTPSSSSSSASSHHHHVSLYPKHVSAASTQQHLPSRTVIGGDGASFDDGTVTANEASFSSSSDSSSSPSSSSLSNASFESALPSFLSSGASSSGVSGDGSGDNLSPPSSSVLSSMHNLHHHHANAHHQLLDRAKTFDGASGMSSSSSISSSQQQHPLYHHHQPPVVRSQSFSAASSSTSIMGPSSASHRTSSIPPPPAWATSPLLTTGTVLGNSSGNGLASNAANVSMLDSADPVYRSSSATSTNGGGNAAGGGGGFLDRDGNYFLGSDFLDDFPSRTDVGMVHRQLHSSQQHRHSALYGHSDSTSSVRPVLGGPFAGSSSSSSSGDSGLILRSLSSPSLLHSNANVSGNVHSSSAFPHPSASSLSHEHFQQQHSQQQQHQPQSYHPVSASTNGMPVHNSVAATLSAQRTIYMGNLPTNITYQQVLNHVHGGLIECVKLMTDKNCAFVTFMDPSAASSFILISSLSPIVLSGLPIRVGWGKPTPSIPAIVMACQEGATRNVYVGNYDEYVTEEELMFALEAYGTVEHVKIIVEKRIAFVHFTSIISAIKAVKGLSMDPKWRHCRINYGKDRCALAGPGGYSANSLPLGGNGVSSVHPSHIANGYHPSLGQPIAHQQSQVAYPPGSLHHSQPHHFAAVEGYAHGGAGANARQVDSVSHPYQFSHHLSAPHSAEFPVVSSHHTVNNASAHLSSSSAMSANSAHLVNSSCTTPSHPTTLSNVSTLLPDATSFPNRTIYLGGLHADITVKDLCDSIRGGLVQNIKYLSDKNIAFVTFCDATDADCFFKRYTFDEGTSVSGLVIKGKRVKIGWGKSSPLPAIVIAALATKCASRNVYIGNIDPWITQEKLHVDFSPFGDIECINFVWEKKIAFVNFCDIISAIKAVEAMPVHPEYAKYKINYGKDRCANMPRPPKQLHPISIMNGHPSMSTEMMMMESGGSGSASTTLNGREHYSHHHHQMLNNSIYPTPDASPVRSYTPNGTLLSAGSNESSHSGSGTMPASLTPSPSEMGYASSSGDMIGIPPHSASYYPSSQYQSQQQYQQKRLSPLSSTLDFAPSISSLGPPGLEGGGGSMMSGEGNNSDGRDMSSHSSRHRPMSWSTIASSGIRSTGSVFDDHPMHRSQSVSSAFLTTTGSTLGF